MYGFGDFLNYLSYSMIGVVIMTAVFLPIYLFLFRREPIHIRGSSVPLFNKIKDSIHSCGSFIELQTCYSWMQANEYKLDPESLLILKETWRLKEIELEEDFARINGERMGKMQ